MQRPARRVRRTGGIIERAAMSLSECDRFEADLQSSAALRAEAAKAAAGTSAATPLARVVALASNKGYSVTVEDARQHLKARATAAGKVLSDAELDGVAGGGTDPFEKWNTIGVEKPTTF
jgi:hypothetical protein